MSPSYRAVNYGVRAAKSIERKLIAEALLRLDRLSPIEAYRYIGFGSVFFTDFLLFHRVLGISAMTNIEEHMQDEERFRFNVPLGAIDLRFGHSNQLLPKLNWSATTIVWLDYDGQLDAAVLADVETVASSIGRASVLIVTVNAQPMATFKPGERVSALRDKVGRERIPLGIEADGHLANWRLAAVSRRIIGAAIERALADRNAPLPVAERLRYRQIFNFRYADGPKMMTTGGIFFHDADVEALEGCQFASLSQVVDGEVPFEVKVPVLTAREVLWLNAQLPTEDPVSAPGVPPADCEAYARVHRHYPLYLDVDV